MDASDARSCHRSALRDSPTQCTAAHNSEQQASHEQQALDILGCQALSCGSSENEILCRVPLLPWLVQDGQGRVADEGTFGHVDIILRAVVLEMWSRGEQVAGERLYLAYCLKRKGSVECKIRLKSFHGLFDAARSGRFNWSHGPMKCTSDFMLKDGAHRAAMALAFGHNQVLLRHPGCKAQANTTSRPKHTLASLKSLLEPAQYNLVAQRNRELFASLGWPYKHP